jgi:CubicO group peptidase (beta-lactamase class C family)
MLQGGVYDGKRYLSEAAIAAMTKPYTTPATGGSYGLAWMIAPHGFLHDGAFKTRMAVIPKEGLVEIFLIQWDGPWPSGVKSFPGMFSETAEASFGKKSVAGEH